MPDQVNKKSNSSWWVYLIRNNRNALYCGVTNNLERRFKMHQDGKGAKALKGKGPLVLEWSQELNNKVSAMRLEYKIKQLKKIDKEALVSVGFVFPQA
ncbi:GIY-YIG nuclease family protein [Vibrio sp. VB16]|uniref:GIY-YIG nuclease family protein n=1 Tax=Vibrio sp. VB16 TaxID=2785746 RepID=UPI00189EDB29|nr:GIY-YIG nuclease family protein [Vibrio sp. VB16]UGA57183.1 GIY-YIG nuclease family protein [Vibrio sp. VB16]